MAISGDKKRDYMRDYMRNRRAEERKAKATGKPASKPEKAKPSHKAAPDDSAALKAAQAEIARLRTENARLQAELTKHASPAPKATAKPETETKDERQLRLYRNEEDPTAFARWGNRHLSVMLARINSLLFWHSSLTMDEHIEEAITRALLRHVGDQDNIDRGIPRSTYRKVLAELAPDKNPGNEAAFIAFKAKDLQKTKTPYRGSIIIPDNRVTTMGAHWKKRDERNAAAKATRAAKAKAK